MKIIVKVTMSTYKLQVEKIGLENFWNTGRNKKILKCTICIGIVIGDKFISNIRTDIFSNR
ncbi:hypothetical protein DERP_015346 [Dermatophagoides pteronyssinus]|uniref:Uncharacterized protein n=1 Tax=Dermatophagoides pteronyssinus TaxID=6956 RepID=A0ABQ8JWL9_DERPT|nr:hypothetical protein DERP_015346 [Dermatophagoides pteronyssinus]